MIIYKTTNLINNKIYIGKDSKNNPKYLGSGKIIKQAIKKYGKNNFKKEIIEECIDELVLIEREKYWIKYYNSTDKNIGYNITVGGDGGDTITNNPNKFLIGERHSQWMLKNAPTRGIQKTPEHIENWKESYGDKWKGENNPNFGSKRNDESKSLMSEIRKEWHVNLPDDERKIIGDKISNSNKGKDGYWKGKVRENK